MDKDVLSKLSQAIRDDLYFYWVAEHFTHWVASGLIPEPLLAPSRVKELYEFLLENQALLLKNLRNR